MVGVPGRSRACRRCKELKIPCDRARPACGRCTRLKHHCDFSQPQVFVHNDENSFRAVYRKPKKSPAVGGKPPGLRIEKAQKCLGANLAPSALPATVPVLAVTQQQLLSYAIASNGFGSTPAVFSLKTWVITALMVSAESGRGMEAAPLACFSAWLGRSDSNEGLVEFSKHLYLKGLVDAKTALCDPSSARSDLTMATCLALMRYETLECPEETKAAYHWHRDGCLRLAELRGADAYDDDLGHQMFLEIRLHGILRALDGQCSTHLASDMWMNRPWKRHSKTFYDRLLDIFARAPDILRRAHGLDIETPDKVLGLLLDLFQSCTSMNLELLNFYCELQQSFPWPLYWECPSKASFPSEISQSLLSSPAVESAAVHFQSLEVAQLLTLLWALQCMLWAGLEDLQQGLQSAGMHRPDSPPTSDQSWLTAMRMILKSFEFCTEPSRSGTGSLLIAGPLNIAIETSKPRPAASSELKIAVAMRKELATRGLKILISS